MSMLDMLGGLAGGLGSSGGVGGDIPSNMVASSAAASVTSNPSLALGGVGGSGVTIGPFAPQFPQAGITGADSINAPNVFTLPGARYATYIALGAAAGLLAWFLIKRKT